MPLRPYACSNCGFWQRYFATPPDCPICTDVRNDLPEDGWEFLTPTDVEARLTCSWRAIRPDLMAFSTAPRFGLDSTGWLLLHEDGNIAFEAAPWYSAAALEEIERLGGIRFLAASHPHGYGALWQLQDRFQPILAIQREDLPFTKAMHVTWPYDERLAVRPGLTLHHVGGHYAGQSVLHDKTRRLLFCGDAFKVDLGTDGTPQGISCHKAFHKQIPLSHDEVRRYRDVIAPLEFDGVLTPFDYAPQTTTALAVRLLDAQLAGPPFFHPMEVAP